MEGLSTEPAHYSQGKSDKKREGTDNTSCLTESPSDLSIDQAEMSKCVQAGEREREQERRSAQCFPARTRH